MHVRGEGREMRGLERAVGRDVIGRERPVLREVCQVQCDEHCCRSRVSGTFGGME